MRKCTIIRIAACVAVVAVATSATLPLCAAEVAADEAREAAQGWAALREALTGKERFAGAEIADVKSYEGKDGRGKFYVVSFEGGGFAVTSGDTEIAPILAYSEDGEFVASGENPLWVMLTTDVAGRTKRLGNGEQGTGNGARRLLKSASAPQSSQASANASAWARLKKASPSAKATEDRAASTRPLLKAALPATDSLAYPIAGPLCETKWNQGGHEGIGGDPCYNYYTPSNFLCGCVATTMAQIMRKFEWPKEKVEIAAVHTGRFLDDVKTPGVVYTNTWHIGGAYGDTWEYPGPAFGGPYDWDNMVAFPRYKADLTEVERQAIGLLCRDCGISVDMNYNLGGSSSLTTKIGPALVSQFGYKNAAVRGNGNAIMLAEQLAAMLPSFDRGSPCGVGISGHSILSDGYGYNSDGRIYIHYNYGWGGSHWYTPPDETESDTEYPVVMSIVYNIWTPDMDIPPDSSIVSGFVVGEDGTSPVAGAAVTATDGLTGASVTGATDATGAFTLYLPPGHDYALTAATNGVAAAWKNLGMVKCSSEAVGNKRDVLLVLGASADGTPVELLHRWSFNGATDAERLADTGGSASPETAATVCGSDPAAVAFADGMVSLSGDGNSKGYLSLATNAIPDTATLELWAREDAVKFWSRVFDYGTDTSNYLMLSWTYGREQRKDRLEVKCAASGTIDVDGTMAPYTPGTIYHFAVSFERDAANGSTLVRMMRRDAKTGELQRIGTRTIENFAVSSLASAVLYLGHSQFTGDADANATYDEVRVWSGIIPDAQLKANAIAGPDVADLAEAAQIAAVFQPSTQIGGHTATRRGRIAYGGNRGGKAEADVDWPKIPLSDYADDGEHDVSELSRAATGGNAPAFLEKSQLRYDGWFEVTEEQAGLWTIRQWFDDYFLFAIDGDFAVFNHKYNDSVTSRVRVAEGWHRFTVICGDTWGGWGAEYVFGDMKVPFTVSINDGEELAFTSDNFTFGSESGVVTLTENTDWTAQGAVTLSPGTVIDLNGHTLKVADIAADGVGAVVTNSAATGGRVVFGGDPSGSASVSTIRFADGIVRESFADLGWVNESAATAGLTGEWDAPLAYDEATWKATLSGNVAFTPNTPSGGNRVTMDVTVAFDAIPAECDAPSNTAQAAIWLGTNGCFQVWSKAGNGEQGMGNGWIDVEADGITPTTGVDYTFRFTFDYAAKTYSVDVKTESTEFTKLRSSSLQLQLETPTATFPLATSASAVSGVRFTGDGMLTSILGEYVVVEGFAEAETVLLKDNAEVILDAAKAAWLNSCAGGKTAVGNAAGGLSSNEFTNAYLLNLDITDGTRSYTFEITDIDVGAENVTVAVMLTRTGEIDQPINGVLKFYGAATLEAFANPALQPLSSETVSDDDFSKGDTATATYPKVSGSTTNTFFKAKIEEK